MRLSAARRALDKAVAAQAAADPGRPRDEPVTPKTIYPFGSSSDGRRAAGLAPSTPLQLAAQLRAEVKAGQVTLAGWATVDGQRAIHLRERMTHGQVNL